MPRGLVPFLAAAAIAVGLGVWSRVTDPPDAALGIGLAAIIALLVVAERRHE